jgi:hypothetical protein
MQLYQIDGWASNYPGMDRSAAIRCLIDSGLHRQRRKPAQQIRDPGTEARREEDRFHESWLWYQRNAEPKRMSPWKGNFGDWGRAEWREAKEAARKQAAELRGKRLNAVAAIRKLLRQRKKKATAEAIVAYFKQHMPDLEAYTLEFVEGALKRLPDRP